MKPHEYFWIVIMLIVGVAMTSKGFAIGINTNGGFTLIWIGSIVFLIGILWIGFRIIPIFNEWFDELFGDK